MGELWASTAYWTPAVTGAAVAKVTVTHDGVTEMLEAGTLCAASTVAPGAPPAVSRIWAVTGVVAPCFARDRSTCPIPPDRPAVKVWAGVSPDWIVPVPT